MKTHCSCGGKRRLALITLYASLCSVLALQLVVQTTGTTSLSADTSTEVSALPGEHGTTVDDLRAYQTPQAIRARARMKANAQRAILHAAPALHTHQVRFGR